MDIYTGWNKSVLGDVRDSLYELEKVSYEIENCYRGENTNVETYRDLAAFIKMLAKDLIAAADDIEDYDEESEDWEDDENSEYWDEEDDDEDAIIGG